MFLRLGEIVFECQVCGEWATEVTYRTAPAGELGVRETVAATWHHAGGNKCTGTEQRAIALGA